ncbi:LuxR C-terminal-related transcriptional regulator [Demequina sp. B12]|uniref:helix-turn-helix transcriptional regulator n=1 Tax=Demequina sp. B12 TaxID=2992757 RepID=UPI00237A54C8|nr:LuxR C-terminal-related transcriptional regulator [Demequina sp. B12]MDE0572620.1 LuxR C-terminal-related transcriptional regulator [Demequina sp. B12]
MATTTEVPTVPWHARRGLETPLDLPDARQAEVEHALTLVDQGFGAILWTAEHGMGRSTLLDALATTIAATAKNGGPLAVRISPDRLDRERSKDSFLAAVLSQVERLGGNSDIELPTERGLEAAIAAQVRQVAGERTLVLLVDDVDEFSADALDALVHMLGYDGSATVALATAHISPFGERPPHDVEVRELPGVSTEGALRVLSEAGSTKVAPHVARALADRLGGNPGCIVQTARRLSPHHLQGTSLLPDPLPLVPAVKMALAPTIADLTERDRAALLIASIAVVDRIDTLTAATGEDVSFFVAGPVAPHLNLLSGGFTFADARMRALLHGEATLAERTAAHEALARAHGEAGEQELASWHTALARIAGEPSVVPDLISLSLRHLRHGDTAWAHAVAREAVGHASGDQRLLACEISGLAAVLSGHIHDAAHWLPHAARSGDLSVRARSLLANVITLTLSDGRVPDDVVERTRAEAESAAEDDHSERIRNDVARGLSAAACLHMERGSTSAAWRRVEEAQALIRDGRCGGRDGTRLARAWLSIYAGESGGEVDLPVQSALADDEALSAVARGVALMADDDCDAAARLLASAVAQLSPVRHGARWFDGADRAASPIVIAHLRVVQSLVEFRAGDVARAAETMRGAAEHLPVGVVLAGLGVTLSRRIDMVRDGAVGNVSEALAVTSPCAATTTVRLGLLVDRAMEASFDGDHIQAATLLEVAAEREMRESQVGLSVPGLDIVESWAMAGRSHEAHRALMRLRSRTGTLSAIGRATVLTRAELAIATDSDIDERIEAANRAARDLTGAYDRGRTELSIGRALARLGRSEQALSYLMSAQDFFDESGADAWAALVREEVRGLTDPTTASRAVAEGEGAVEFEPASRTDDGWDAELTEREREVAQLVAQGYANRDVAERLYVSVRTVEVHLGRVYRKLGLRSRVELAVLAHRFTDDA